MSGSSKSFFVTSLSAFPLRDYEILSGSARQQKAPEALSIELVWTATVGSIIRGVDIGSKRSIKWI